MCIYLYTFHKRWTNRRNNTVYGGKAKSLQFVAHSQCNLFIEQMFPFQFLQMRVFHPSGGSTHPSLKRKNIIFFFSFHFPPVILFTKPLME